MPRIVHMIAGFRGTGKDTLHKDLLLGNIVFHKFDMPRSDYTWIPLWMMFLLRMFTLGMAVLGELCSRMSGHPQRVSPKWYVFSTRSSAIRACQEHLLVTRDRQQTAFARELKSLVHQKINSSLQRATGKDSLLTDEWFEKNKEQKIRINAELLTTPRELYIVVGEAEKRRDPMIWARKCFESFEAKSRSVTRSQIQSQNNSCESLAKLGSAEIIDITDWRFRSEQTYAGFYSGMYKIFTTRIYRSCIFPPKNPTERDLDRVTTDLLLVQSKFELMSALVRWPQYSRHMLIGELRHLGS